MLTSYLFCKCEKNVLGVVDKPLVLKSMIQKFVAGLILCSSSLFGEILSFMLDWGAD